MPSEPVDLQTFDLSPGSKSLFGFHFFHQLACGDVGDGGSLCWARVFYFIRVY